MESFNIGDLAQNQGHPHEEPVARGCNTKACSTKALNVFLKPRREAGIGVRPGQTLVQKPLFKRWATMMRESSRSNQCVSFQDERLNLLPSTGSIKGTIS